MNLLKSLFVSLFLMVTAVVFIHSVSEFFSKGFHYAWLGSALTSGAVLFFFGWMYIGKPPRTSINLWGYTFAVLVGTTIALTACAFWNLDCSSFLLAAFISAGWIAYNYWYAFFPKRQTAVRIGEQIPYFSAKNEEGEIISSDHLKGSPTLFLFYRGNWCPLCMAQIREIAEHYKAVSEGGTKILLISPQNQKHTKKLAAQYKVPFRFIVDADFKLARLFGVLQSNGTPFGFQVFGFDSDTVYPLVLITDAGNSVVYINQTFNYRVRPEPSEFIKILSRLKLHSNPS